MYIKIPVWTGILLARVVRPYENNEKKTYVRPRGSPNIVDTFWLRNVTNVWRYALLGNVFLFYLPLGGKSVGPIPLRARHRTHGI